MQHTPAHTLLFALHMCRLHKSAEWAWATLCTMFVTIWHSFGASAQILACCICTLHRCSKRCRQVCNASSKTAHVSCTCVHFCTGYDYSYAGSGFSWKMEYAETWLWTFNPLTAEGVYLCIWWNWLFNRIAKFNLAYIWELFKGIYTTK